MGSQQQSLTGSQSHCLRQSIWITSMEVGGSHLIAMEAEQLKDMLARVKTRRTKGVLLVQELKKRESKFRSQLTATSASLASYLDQLQKVVDCVRVSEAHEIGEGLAKVVVWQRKMQEGLVEMFRGWEIKDVMLDNFVDERGKKSKLMCCLRKRNKQAEEEKEEVMLRMLIKKALEEERLYYQAILLGLKDLVKGGPSLLGLGPVEALEKATQAKVAPSESLSTMRRTSLSSMASFSYSPGPEKASDSDDSGILSQGHESVSDMWQSSTRAQRGPIKSTPADYEVPYTTVRRSPSPCFSPLRSPSPSLQNVQPPKIMDASTIGTLGCDKMRSQRPSRPPTQRCGRSPSQAGPWGRSLSNSSLFPRPCSPTTSDSGEEAAVNTSKEAAIAGRRMEKRQRNLTQAVSLSSLRASIATDSNTTEESTSHRSSPEALKLQLPVDFDLQSAEEPLVSDMNHPISLKETLNKRPRESSGVSRTRQVSEEETRSFPESPSSLPPPPPFLLNPVQTFQQRNPNHPYGIFEP